VPLQHTFIEENQTLGINLVLTAFPARAMASCAGAILLGSKYLFFTTYLLAMNEVPDRSIAHLDALFGRRPMGPPSFSTPRCPSRESAATISRRSKRHPQRRRNRANRLPRSYTSNGTITQVQGRDWPFMPASDPVLSRIESLLAGRYYSSALFASPWADAKIPRSATGGACP